MKPSGPPRSRVSITFLEQCDCHEVMNATAEMPLHASLSGFGLHGSYFEAVYTPSARCPKCKMPYILRAIESTT